MAIQAHILYFTALLFRIQGCPATDELSVSRLNPWELQSLVRCHPSLLLQQEEAVGASVSNAMTDILDKESAAPAKVITLRGMQLILITSVRGFG